MGMNIKDVVFCAVIVLLSFLWYGDRSKQFEKGKLACANEYTEARDKYVKELTDRHKEELKAAAERAEQSNKENNENEKERTIFVDKVRTIHVPSECRVPVDFVREFNKARDSLRKK